MGMKGMGGGSQGGGGGGGGVSGGVTPFSCYNPRSGASSMLHPSHGSIADQFQLSPAAQAASRMYFNSQFFPQMGGMAGMVGGGLPHHHTTNNTMHSMNMLYMDSLGRQEHCGSGRTDSSLFLEHSMPD